MSRKRKGRREKVYNSLPNIYFLFEKSSVPAAAEPFTLHSFFSAEQSIRLTTCKTSNCERGPKTMSINVSSEPSQISFSSIPMEMMMAKIPSEPD